ncbi:MAG: hypothetical protein QOE70_4337 [Chthoniobacter sp.]|jgi:hypothetical protein|nr:hypothetical protein [Chthoniobacter sp.]
MKERELVKRKAARAGIVAVRGEIDRVERAMVGVCTPGSFKRYDTRLNIYRRRLARLEAA